MGSLDLLHQWVSVLAGLPSLWSRIHQLGLRSVATHLCEYTFCDSLFATRRDEPTTTRRWDDNKRRETSLQRRTTKPAKSKYLYYTVLAALCWPSFCSSKGTYFIITRFKCDPKCNDDAPQNNKKVLLTGRWQYYSVVWFVGEDVWEWMRTRSLHSVAFFLSRQPTKPKKIASSFVSKLSTRAENKAAMCLFPLLKQVGLQDTSTGEWSDRRRSDHRR